MSLGFLLSRRLKRHRQLKLAYRTPPSQELGNHAPRWSRVGVWEAREGCRAYLSATPLVKMTPLFLSSLPPASLSCFIFLLRKGNVAYTLALNTLKLPGSKEKLRYS